MEIQANVVAEILRLQIFEQTVLLNAVTAYMNLLRDAAILELQRSNVNVLEIAALEAVHSLISRALALRLGAGNSSDP